MSEPFSDTSFVDDLHEMMAAAILAEQRGVEVDASPIFEAWGASYPEDALGPVGRGLTLIRTGNTKEGFSLIEGAAQNAKTRQDQARDVLESLKVDLTSVDA